VPKKARGALRPTNLMFWCCWGLANFGPQVDNGLNIHTARIIDWRTGSGTGEIGWANICCFCKPLAASDSISGKVVS
jgi:hypothetical protein